MRYAKPFTLIWEVDHMHTGSKGWYVNELHKMGIRHIDKKKLETYKTYVLANLYDEKRKKK